MESSNPAVPDMSSTAIPTTAPTPVTPDEVANLGSSDPEPDTTAPSPDVPTPDNSTSDSRSYLVAFMLSLFLGNLGADRFYLGYIGTGVLKLITFGGFGIWTLIDMIMIFTGHKQAKDGSTLTGYQENKKTATIVLVIVILLSILPGFLLLSALTAGGLFLVR